MCRVGQQGKTKRTMGMAQSFVKLAEEEQQNHLEKSHNSKLAK